MLERRRQRRVLFGGSIGIDSDDEDAEAIVSRTACCCVHEKRGNHLGVYKLLNDRGSSINDSHNGQEGRHGCRRCCRWWSFDNGRRRRRRRRLMLHTIFLSLRGDDVDNDGDDETKMLTSGDNDDGGGGDPETHESTRATR